MGIKPSLIGLMNMEICISDTERSNAMLDIVGAILMLSIAVGVVSVAIAFIIAMLFKK